MLPQKMVMTLKKLLLPNIMTLMKSITLKYLSKINPYSLFHINTCSLNKNFDNLQHLLSCTQKNFGIIAISETRVKKNISLLNNLNFNNYSFESTPTETSATAGRILLYIANHLSYI